ncbi:MAG: threonine synthase [Acidiferrobacterales bacterium]|nr:threonine synthase [Acidiferrobacterales bacterium]
MDYISTRGNSPVIDFEHAATCGLAADGGLYVPASWPKFSRDEIATLKGLSYTQIAERVIARFVGDTISPQQLGLLIESAYEDFDDPQIAPVRELREGLYLLELFHGPTLSFKDYALQFLGRFMDWSLRRNSQRLTVVGATSGDTGSAAISAVGGCPVIELYMLHPFQKVSDMQRRQMTTNQDHNIFNYAVDGTFDDCQAMVKEIFNDNEMRMHRSLGAVNSINWGRITAQVVYYFHAAVQLGAPQTAVSFAVPTGNFGNVFAGYTASCMGLPIERMIVCSNENDILTRFFETGVMKKQGVRQTVTPSMDIEVSSNFERFLFDLLDRDGHEVTELMRQLRENGQFEVDPDTLHRARSHFDAIRADQRETCDAIARLYSETGMIIDPHSAVALSAVDHFDSDSDSPLVVISTAHPAKFPDTIERSVSAGVQVPSRLAGLLDMPERYRRISSNPDELKKLMLAA